MTSNRFPLRPQRGAVLVVGLIMLVVISLMGAVAYGVATQQERISGNARDRMRAFESAEASLRDCEAYLADPGRTPTVGGADRFIVAANAPGTAQASDSNDITFWRGADVKILTGAAAIAGVAAQPSCMIEQLIDMWVPDTSGSAGMNPLRRVTIYRVTATGFGTRLDTTAKVQSTFRRL